MAVSKMKSILAVWPEQAPHFVVLVLIVATVSALGFAGIFYEIRPLLWLGILISAISSAYYLIGLIASIRRGRISK